MRVVGLDMSLTGTALAVDGGEFEGKPVTTTITLDPAPRRGMERIRWIRDAVVNHVAVQAYGHNDEMPRDVVVVIEDYAFSRSNHAHEIGELGGIVKDSLFQNGFPYVLVNPKHLKTYAVGKGGGKGTDKIAMGVAAMKRAGLEFSDDNQCDAWWLRMMGLDAYGAPLVEMPPSHRAALSQIEWPTVVGEVLAPVVAS